MKYPISISRFIQRAALAAGISTLPAQSFAQGLPTGQSRYVALANLLFFR